MRRDRFFEILSEAFDNFDTSKSGTAEDVLNIGDLEKNKVFSLFFNVLFALIYINLIGCSFLWRIIDDFRWILPLVFWEIQAEIAKRQQAIWKIIFHFYEIIFKDSKHVYLGEIV